MSGEVPLELLGEAAQQLHVGVVAGAALVALGVVPALGPQQHRCDQVTDDVGAVRVGRSLGLRADRVEERRHRVAGLSGQRDRAAAAPGEQPTGGDPLRASVEDGVREAQHRAAQVFGVDELVDLAAPDHGDARGLDRRAAAVDQMRAAAGRDEDQLVVVVAVRLEPVLGDVDGLEQAQLDDRSGVEAVDGEIGEGGGSAQRPP